MRYRVIISHNQTESIRKFQRGCPTVFVFDAPTKDDIVECTMMGYDNVIMPVAGNRSANRNAGLACIMHKYDLSDTDAVEFFDGDRFPVVYDADKVSSMLNDTDVLLYTCRDDARFERIAVPEEGSVVCDTGRICNPFYSCGFAMKVSAIGKVVAKNGGNGHLFEPRFTRWGCEDQYLGIECANIGIRVAITREVVVNGSVGGDSGSHFDYRESLQQYVDLMRENKLVFR